MAIKISVFFVQVTSGGKGRADCREANPARTAKPGRSDEFFIGFIIFPKSKHARTPKGRPKTS